MIDVPKLYYRIGGRGHKMPSKGSLSLGSNTTNKLGRDKANLTGGFARAVAKEKLLGAFRSKTRGEEKDLCVTFKDWLLQYTENDMAYSIFDTITNTLCTVLSHEISPSAVLTWLVRMGAHAMLPLPPRQYRQPAETG